MKVFCIFVDEASITEFKNRMENYMTIADEYDREQNNDCLVKTIKPFIIDLIPDVLLSINILSHCSFKIHVI